jgi:hypothetical protein
VARKTKKESEFKKNRGLIPPVYSNVVATVAGKTLLLLDFGLVAPSYFTPYDMEDSQVARILLPWESAENLLELLQDTISDHKKEQKPKRKAKHKSERG